MATTTTCPFCNATVPLALPLPANRRLPCPRCGEQVPIKSEDGLASRVPFAGLTQGPGSFLQESNPQRTNRKVALGVLGLMIVMAGTALTYALMTVEWRRANDQKAATTATAPIVPPGRGAPVPELAGLGYLPDETQLVAGIRLAEACASQPGVVVLSQLGLSPDANRRIAGLKTHEVDHMILGAVLRAIPPRLTLVVRARASFDTAHLREAIQATRSSERGGKSLFDAKLTPKGIEGVFWLPNANTIVGALLKDDFDKLPNTAAATSERFSVPLPELLKERIDPSALAWAVLHVEPNDASFAALTGFLPLPAEEQAAWGKLLDLALSVRVNGPQITLSAHLHGRDGTVTDQIGEIIAKSLTDAGVTTSERARDGDWLRLTATADAAIMAKWAERFRRSDGK